MKMVIPAKQPDLSPTKLPSGLVATVGLLLTANFGMIGATLEPDSLVLLQLPLLTQMTLLVLPWPQP